MTQPVEAFGNYVGTLPAATTVNSTDQLYVLQGGISKSAKANQMPPGPQGPPGVGPISINTLTSSPLVGDGVTSNTTQLQSLEKKLQGVGTELPIAVTLTIGTPTVVTWPVSPHNLRPNQAFYFTTTGTLPTGITANTPYYITATNLKAGTFTFSTINNSGTLVGEGTTVNSSGSVTGTTSVVLTGRNWIDIFIPPGAYSTSGGPNIYLIPNGISRIRWNGYGAVFGAEVTFGVFTQYFADPKTWSGQTSFDFVNTTPNELNTANLDAVIQLQTIAHASNYFIGQWIIILGYDTMDYLNVLTSGPPNDHFWEYKQIKAIDTVGGTITVNGPLKWVYLQTWPNLYNVSGSAISGGPATIVAMNPAWDVEVIVKGVRWTAAVSAPFARHIEFEDCIWDGYGVEAGTFAPTMAKEFIYRNCVFGPGNAANMQTDKNIEYLEFDNCRAYEAFSFPSTSVHTCVIRSSRIIDTGGTPRNIRVLDSELDFLRIGTLFFGVTDNAVVQNSRIGFFDATDREDDPPNLPSFDMTLVPNFTFSNGTFSRTLTGLNQPLEWMVPGVKGYFISADAQLGAGASLAQNMGNPFTVLNTYMSGGVMSFDTTLSAIPTRQTSSTVTITIASPAVVTWTAHGLTAGTPVCFTTTGALPTGLSRSTVYYVLATGLTTNTFEVSTSAGGSAVNTSGTQSGTHTAYGNPLCFRPHPCPRFTGFGNSGCMSIIDLNGAIDEPLFSRCKRAFVGQQSTNVGYQSPQPKIWGNLISMTVNVVKAATGGSVAITVPGFTQPNLGTANFSQTINLATAGIRTVTNATTSGGVAGDTLVSFGNWLGGLISFTFSSPPAGIQNNAVWTFEILTDQGITRFGTLMGRPVGGTDGIWIYNDSGIISVNNS